VNGDSLASLIGTLTFATTATAASPVGTYSVTPQGVSSPNYTIAFVAGTLSVVPASTATSVVASPNPSGFNQAVTLAASVSVMAPGAGSPSGVVQFFDGGTLLGTAPLAAGSATLTTNGLAAGSHAISAAYSGAATFAASSGAAALKVNTASASSTTTVTSSAMPATVGQSVTLTATVAASGSLSGSVAFHDGSVLLGTVALTGTTARLTTAALASGGHAIAATYLGNASIPPSTSAAFAQYVQPSGAKTRASTVAVAASPSPATLGSSITLTATVTGSNRQVPSGQVLFMLNGSVLGQGTLTATGTATASASVSTSTLSHGTHQVEAVYLGDDGYRASTTSMTVVVN
jgi:Big-like domain-containing protein/MBG domain-containing protein